jgi:ribosome-binding factor A
MGQHRAERVSEAMREELSEIIGYEMADPRIDMVDVTEVIMGPDGRHARVRVHLAGDEKSRMESLLALAGARQFLRRQLAARLRLFRIPELHFEADLDVAAAARVAQLLKRARKGRSKSDRAEEKSSLE